MPESSSPREGESRSEFIRRQRQKGEPFDIEVRRQQRACDHLEHGAEMVALRKVNGDLVAYNRCRGCGGRFEEFKVYSRAEVPHPEQLPLVRDEIYSRPPCEVCGSFGTEEHHWAPREFFGWEAYHWPTSFLCRPCHARWHRTMREAIAYKDRQQANVEAARPPVHPTGRPLGRYRGAP